VGKVLVTRKIPENALDDLVAVFGKEAVDHWSSDDPIPREALLERAAGKEGVFALLTERIDGDFLDAAGPRLRIVANMAVGYDNVDVAAATARNVYITNTPGVLTETTADLAFALILGAARRLGEAERFVRAGKWHTWSPTLLLGVDVYDQTLGIFGMGRIGQAVARRAQGFGMKILYHNRNRLPAACEAELNATHVPFETLLRESDVLSVHCPLTDDTRHRFGADEFAAMKPTAVFVNTTRGPVVDEAALAQALAAGTVFAAGLDVFEEEPAIHPGLLACENALLIPHLGSASQATRARMAAMAAANIIACLRGEAPPNAVNGDEVTDPRPS